MEPGFKQVGERNGEPIVVSETVFEEVKRCLVEVDAEMRKTAVFDRRGEPVGVYGLQLYEDEQVLIPDSQRIDEDVAVYTEVDYPVEDDVSFP